MRAVGIDLGARRIGVAVSDPSGTLASPHEVVPRGPDHAIDHARLAAIVEAAGAEVAELRSALAVPVEVYDERFSTVTAHRAMQARGKREKERRKVVDQVAAAVFLQSWLDGRANRADRG